MIQTSGVSKLILFLMDCQTILMDNMKNWLFIKWFVFLEPYYNHQLKIRAMLGSAAPI